MEQTNKGIVQNRLEALEPIGKYQVESLEAMKKRYFIDKASQLDSVPQSKVLGYDFQYEMELGEKRLKRIENIKNEVVKLERHAYAPEMNCLHFENGNTFKVKGFLKMDEAIMFMAISLSKDEIMKTIGVQ
jgi:hypothetical protein